jgi:hypothetical protein
MTTLLTREQVDAVRSIGDGALVLFVMILIDKNYPGRHTKATELLPYIYPVIKDIRTLEPRMNALCASGRIARTSAGYVLLEGGRALILQAQQDQAQEVKALAQNEGLKGISPLPASPILEDHQNRGGEEPYARNVRALKKEEEVDSSLNLNINDSTTSTLRDAQFVQNDWPTVKTILAATPVLFGEPGVVSRGLQLDVILPWMALGWIAHAWDQWPQGGGHGHLQRPAGLVYKNLEDPDAPKPRAKYYNGGWDILPDAFMELIGLREYPCEGCEAVFKKRAEYDEHISMTSVCEHCMARGFHMQEELDKHYRERHPEPEPIEPDETAKPGSEMVQAWERVKEQLQREMPRASYDTWVRDTQLVHYENGIMSVGVHNAYARDWLDSRMVSTAQRLLVGIMNADVRVIFVVAHIESEDE